MGCAILPHLRSLVEIIEHGLVDEQQKVRTITALALAALAEAATPYGIESFDSVLKPLWKGIRTHRGKGLAAFLKAIGYLIPLMDAEYANYYTREVMLILIREFQSPDEEMKKIVLKVPILEISIAADVPLVPLLLLGPTFISDYSFLVLHSVNRGDRHLLAHAMASDLTVTWQFSSQVLGTIF
jgi:hypothetical protein